MSADHPDIPTGQQTAEVQNIKERIDGQEAQNGNAAIEGKVKQILDDIKRVQEDFAPLGAAVKEQFDNYLDAKLGQDVNISNADQAQQKVSEWVERLDQQNLETLRNFDKGLDMVMLRVEFRKQMAQTLSGLNHLSEAQKNGISTAVERQLNFKEDGRIDTNKELSVQDFKDRLSAMHSISKYAKMLNVATERGADSLAKSTAIPEFGVAYPPTAKMGFIHFKYWIEKVDGVDQLHCIDNNGAVQRLNPFVSTEFNENPWTVVYNPFTKQRSRGFNTSEADITRYKPNTNELTPAARQQMLENFTYERSFINASARNFKDYPADQLREVEALIVNKFNEFKQTWENNYTTTPGSNSSFMPVRETYGYVSSDQFKNEVKSQMAQVPMITRGLTQNNAAPSTSSGQRPSVRITPQNSAAQNPGTNPDTADQLSQQQERVERLRSSITPTSQIDQLYLGGTSATNRTLSTDMVIATLPDLPNGGPIQRRVLSLDAETADHLEIRGNQVILKANQEFLVNPDSFSFQIEAKEGNSDWEGTVIEIPNENPEQALEQIKTKHKALSIGALSKNEDYALEDYENVLPAGYELKTGEIIAINYTTSRLRDAIGFKVEDNKVFYEGDETLEVGSLIKLRIPVSTPTGETEYLELDLTISQAQALRNQDINVAGGNLESVNGNETIKVREPIDPYDVSNSPTEISELLLSYPIYANLTVKNVYNQIGNEETLTSGAPIIQIENGKFVLQPGQKLEHQERNSADVRDYSYAIELESTVGGIQGTHRIVFDVKSPDKIAAEVKLDNIRNIDAEFPNTIEQGKESELHDYTGEIPNGYSFGHASLVQAEALGGLASTARASSLFKIEDNKLIYRGIVGLRNGQGFNVTLRLDGPNGKSENIQYRFEVAVPQPVQEEDQPQENPNTPSQTPEQTRNINSVNQIYELWKSINNETLYSEMGTFNLEEPGLFTIATIDAAKGELAVANDGFATLMSVKAGQIVLEAGTGGNRKTMSFPNNDEGRKEAMAYAVAINTIKKNCLRNLDLKNKQYFDSGSQDGNFIEYEGGVIEVNNRNAMFDSHLWTPNSSKYLKTPEEITAFVDLVNAGLKDFYKDNNYALDNYTESTSEFSFENTDESIQEGSDYEFKLTKVDTENFKYTYSGNRIDWHEIDETSITNNEVSLEINAEEFDGGSERLVTSNGRKYMRLSVLAVPKDKDSGKLPRLIETDIEIKNEYSIDSVEPNSVSLKGNFGGEEITYNLEAGISDQNNNWQAETLSMEQDPENVDQIIVKNTANHNEVFAVLKLIEGDVLDCTEESLKDGYTYTRATNGAQRSISFSKD